MNTQQLSEKIRDHLLNQMAVSRTSDPTDCSVSHCAYRGDNNTQCAVGCLIKDEFYKPSLEGNTIGYGHVRNAVIQSIGRELEENEYNMLGSWQQYHDDHFRFWLLKLKSIDSPQEFHEKMMQRCNG